MRPPPPTNRAARPCAGCMSSHDDSRERWTASPGRWLCWAQYDKELNNKLARGRDTLA